MAYEHDFKIWGPHVADEFTQCVRLFELRVKTKGKGTTLASEVSRIIHGNIFESAREPEKDSSNN
jgi:hypothetical protein